MKLDLLTLTCIFSLLVAVEPWKIPGKWPPEVVYQYYDIPTMVKTCSQRCEPNMEEIKEFELTTDLNKLPNNKNVKCYFHCLWVEAGFMKPGSAAFDPSVFFELMEKMSEEDQDKYLKITKGCAKRVSKIKDPIEVSYQTMVCCKENSNELFYLFY
ncbi:uncharacterized protein LOC116342996 [Contarinia nasturtii]|uniref:uncharacterized protein LOC116342996 n=1 Tax=Contarinia nasturtii TaxID=265458 RepID=UPI0012D41B80|nr:uncharacterized protein LOC116342996 [Contarinia nasturtii]